MRTRQQKLLVSLAILGAAASIAGLGTYASFTSSTSASQTIQAATVSLVLGAPGPQNRLSIGASGLLGGDSVESVVDLVNNGSLGSDQLSSVSLTTTASPSSLLDTDATNGLQMTIDDCSQAWSETALLDGGYSYDCGGSLTMALPSRAVVGSNLALANLTSLTTNSTDHLRITLALPATADNSFQGLSSTLTYTFTGNQRAAASR